MPARSKARKRALDILYESELRGLALDATLEERRASAEATGHLPVNDYTVLLVHGVTEQQARIDGLLTSYSEGWTLERMPSVDRNILRIGLYEVLYVDDVPDAVAVSEAIALARELSTDESPTFVNGILGNVVRNKAALSA
jgi:N utilization substance protein B